MNSMYKSSSLVIELLLKLFNPTHKTKSQKDPPAKLLVQPKTQQSQSL